MNHEPRRENSQHVSGLTSVLRRLYTDSLLRLEVKMKTSNRLLWEPPIGTRSVSIVPAIVGVICIQDVFNYSAGAMGYLSREYYFPIFAGLGL